MVLREDGLSEKSIHSIFGITDTESVKLDLDNVPFEQVKSIALATLRHFRLGGFLILKSSSKSYHVVFNRTVSWSKNVGIVAWVCLKWKIRKLTEWLIMQCIKRASTLRVTSKGNKPSPRIVFRFEKQDKQIKVFLLERRRIKRIMHRIKNSN